jgi:hypothetical protein
MKTPAVCLRSLPEWEIPIPSRVFLLFVLALLTGGASPWGRNKLAGQERRDGSVDPGVGVLQGTVVDHETRDPVWGAAVSLRAGPSGTRGRGTRVTGDAGRFLFRDVPQGSYLLSVTVQGYRTMVDTVEVSAEVELELLLPLSTEPIRLEPIIVIAERRPPPRRDYERRRLSRSVFIVTREEIEERNPRLLTEMLNRTPGGIVLSTPPFGYTLFLRGQCRPGIWVDGMKVPYVDSIDQLISPRDVEAVEVYHGFELPVEFGVDPCGGVLIWTRMGEAPPPGTEADSVGGILGQIVLVGGVIFMVMMVLK